MNKQIIKTIIGEKQQQIAKTKLLQRSGQFDERSCYVLVGIRRAGKSYTLYQDMQAKLSAGTAKAKAPTLNIVYGEEVEIQGIHTPLKFVPCFIQAKLRKL